MLRWPEVLRRPVAAGALLLALYAGLSFTKDPRGYLGTDTGGKVATLRAMEQRGDLHPDVGYWAEQWDPKGDLHPLYFTEHKGQRWVTVTTLPMLYASYPLYRVAGLRALIVFPALGALAAAFAARRLARLIGRAGGDGGGDGWAAFWLIGLASPLVIYALDFWEHAPGVGLMGWGVALLVGDRPGWRRFALAGLAFGAAATLRTEALVYAGVAAGVAGLALLRSRPRPAWALPVSVGLAFTLGLALPLGANVGLERAALGGDLRGARAAGLVDAAGSEAVAGPSRAEEALITTVSSAVKPPGDYIFGGALVALVAYAAARGRQREQVSSVVALLGVVVGYGRVLLTGVRFIPGMFVAAPLAVVGVVARARSGVTRSVLAVALLALPLVWALQYLGGAHPQWGGRYTLTSGFLLGVLGISALRDLPRVMAVVLAGIACAVSVFGLLWLRYRSDDVARVMAMLRGRPEPVLVFRMEHLAREGGSFYPQRWLTAESDDEERRAAAIVSQAGFDELAVVAEAKNHPERRVPDGYRRVRTDSFRFLDLPMRIVTFRRVR